MMRRVVVSTAVAATTGSRWVSNEFKEITKPGSPQPPMISKETVMPMDFSPHIEWYEYPKEVFDPQYPFSREETLRMMDEGVNGSQGNMEDYEQRYGVRVSASTKVYFWLAYFSFVWLGWWALWASYRAIGLEPRFNVWFNTVANDPNAPVLEEDDIYLDQWMLPRQRYKMTQIKFDDLWQWRPPAKEGGATEHPWRIPFQVLDPVEWRHMTSAS